MPSRRGAPPPGRRPHASSRSDSSETSGPTHDADGALVFHAKEDGLPPRTAARPEDEMLAQLRADRDATLEEVAYLKEQLRNLTVFHAHLLEQERQRMLQELDKMASQLSGLREELHRRTFPAVARLQEMHVPLTMSSPDGDGTGPDGDGTGIDREARSGIGGDGTGSP